MILRHYKLFEGFYVSLGVDPFRARRGGLRAESESMSSSPPVECDLLRASFRKLVVDYGIPRDVRVMLSKRSQTIFDAPLGFVGLYTHSFTLSNLRIPLPKFSCEVLNYFKVHISCFNPFGLAKLMTFGVMCKAYGSEPSVELLRAFLNLGPAGNWLTLSNRGDANVPKTITKPFTHIEGWEEMDFRSFMMEGIDGEFHFLPREDTENQGGDSPSVSVNKETLATYVEPLNVVAHSQFAENMADSDDTSLEKDEVILIDRSVAKKVKNRKVSASSKVAGKRNRLLIRLRGGRRAKKTHKVLPQASKAAGEPSDPLDVDSDPDIHEFPSAKELKDSTYFSWVVAHVTPPSWKHHLKETSLDKLCDIHDKAYMWKVVLDNVMNRTTRELMSTLSEARAACDTIQEREKEKDKAYAELEAKCNDALRDLDKNPLVLDLRAKIETL
ncbi:hypothetical protein Tco_0663783 [Tanacetum coccineum]